MLLYSLRGTTNDRLAHDGRHEMKQMTMIAIVLAAVGFALPAFAQYEPDEATGPANVSNHGSSAGDGPSYSDKLPSDPEGNAEDLRLHGKCEQAIPIFRRLAANGAGYEIAQYNLGLCLFDLSKAEADASRAANLRQDAAKNILAAANNGLAKAQASLVVMYLDGAGVEHDPVQAGMWSLIYHANGARIAIGLPNISEALQARLDGALSDTAWQQARSRADTWAPHSQNAAN
jgi:hypothetical protein